MKIQRIALIHSHFGPYHFERAEAFAQLFKGDFYPIELCSGERGKYWSRQLSRIRLRTLHEGVIEGIPRAILTKKLVSFLTEVDSQAVVIAGYYLSVFREAARWARRKKVPAILLSESQLKDRPKILVLEKLKGLWIRRYFSAAFVGGASSALYLEKIGFPSNRIWRGYDVASPPKIQQMQIANDPSRESGYFLFVGRLAPEKNIQGLLKSYRVYRKAADQNARKLVIVGAGPLEKELKALGARLGLSESVQWIGFAEGEELCVVYLRALCLTLPSISEPWGLVVNEAMTSGLPILASDRCGCVPDLVFPGINGRIFNPGDVHDLANAMKFMSELPEADLQLYRNSSLEIISHYRPENWGRALLDCLMTVGGN